LFYKLIQLFKSLNKKEAIAIVVATAVILVAAIFYAGYFINTHTIQVASYGGMWREGVVGQPVFINPVISVNETDHDIIELVFNDLEGLSTSIKPNLLFQEWTVRLAEDLKWSDGARITSDDIIFTFEAITDPSARSPLAASFEGASAERISELEVKFSLPASYVFFSETLSNLKVIPKHIFSAIPPANFGLSTYIREPVGSGPYKFKSYKQRPDGFISEYTLVANQNYHGKIPYIKNFIFKFYKDEALLIEAFNNGRIDGLPVADPALLSQIAVIKSAHSIPSTRYFAVFLNPGLIPQFRDINIRKSLSHFAPREKLVNDIFKEFARPSFGPFAAKTIQADELFVPAENSLVGLEFRLTVPDVAPLPAMANELKTAWEAEGAVVDVRVLRAADIQESIRNRDYEALLFGNILSIPNDLHSFWHSSKRFYPGLNLAFFNNQEADKIMEYVRSETAPEKKQDLLKRLSAVIIDNIGAVFTVFPDYIYVTSPRLNGFIAEKAITSADRLDNVELWYVKTNRVFK